MIKGFLFVDYENAIRTLPILPTEYEITSHEMAKSYMESIDKTLGFPVTGYLYILKEKGEEK